MRTLPPAACAWIRESTSVSSSRKRFESFMSSVRVGGNRFDEAITNYVRRNYGILIGEATAERIKIEIGSAYPGQQVREMSVKGRNLSEGVPRSFTLNSN